MESTPAVALGHLLANKGIAPFLLASNITDPAYQSVRLWKEPGAIMVETVCKDDETDNLWTFVYRYTDDQVLLHIDMIISGQSHVYWDREQEAKRLATEIVAHRESQAAPQQPEKGMAEAIG